MIKPILRITSDDLSSNYSIAEQDSISFNLETLYGSFDDEDILLNLVKTPYLPQKGDKIYFLPAVNVPRVKFKNVCLEYHIKTVRDATQANVFFGNSKSIHEMTDSMWQYKVKSVDFLFFLEELKSKMDTYYYDKVITAFEFYENEFVAVGYNVMFVINTLKVTTEEYSRYSSRLLTIENDYISLYDHLQTVVVYDEATVIDILNGEDATIIDEPMYDQLSQMFDSSDTDNHVLAMEIMANSKYTESLVYLELLFNQYEYKISGSNTKTHVNFKSLISYLDKNSRYLNTNIDDIAKSLISKDQFTTDKIEIVLKHLHERISVGGDSQYFSVKTVTISPEYVNLIDSNYTYEIISDYVPEVSPEDLCSEPAQEEDEDELIEAAFTNIERIELKTELITLEEEITISESELNKLEDVPLEVITDIEPILTNSQTKTNESTDIDWF
jgi:hypothetical protein